MNSEKIFWAMVVVLVAGFAMFLAFGGLSAPVNAVVSQQAAQQGSSAQAAPAPAGGSLAEVKNGVQEITLTVEGSSYSPNPIRVKKGIPVRLVADMSKIPGCSRSVVISEFGIRKVLSASDNTIEFTPDKSGTFDFSCSMGMYRGKIVVEETDGSVAAFSGSAPKAAAPAGTGGSCGIGGGGCGCGG